MMNSLSRNRIGWALIAAILIALFTPPHASALPPPAPGVVLTQEQIQNLKNADLGDPRDGKLAQRIQRIKAIKEAMLLDPTLQLAAPALGALRVPMLLGEYWDTTALFTTTQMDNKIFESNPTGTLVSYYQEISYGQLSVIGDTYGWFKAPQHLSASCWPFGG